MPVNSPAALPEVAAIILNWNGAQDTIGCMESLLRLTYRPLRIIIVDNGSTDGSVETIRRYLEGIGTEPVQGQPSDAPVPFLEFTTEEAGGRENLHPGPQASGGTVSIVLIRNPGNSGYARGNNLGIRFALRAFSPAYILVLNNDVTLPDPLLLNHLVSLGEEDPRIGVMSPVVRSPDGSIQRTCTRSLPRLMDFLFVYSFLGQRVLRENRFWRKHYHYDYQFDVPREFEVISGAFMLFRTAALRVIGLFDEDTFLYWEEHMAGRRLKDLGWKSVLVPRETAIHRGESAIHSFGLKSWARYWSVRGELIYLARYSGLNLPGRVLVRATLFLEACLGIVLAAMGTGQFDARCELRILILLLLPR